MPADPAAVPPPEWAVKMAKRHYGFDDDDDTAGRAVYAGINGIARLLASVREGAIRRASEVAYDVAEENPKEVRNAILALLHTPPSGGGGA